MATRNNFTPSSDGTLPQWVIVQAVHSPEEMAWGMQYGLRCRDADLVFDLPLVEILVAPGRSERLAMTKRKMLEHIHAQVVTQLALLTLEDK